MAPGLPESGWELAAAAPGSHAGPEEIDGLDWLPARVPGTVAADLRAAGREAGDPDGSDWWYRTSFAAPSAGEGEDVRLCLDGLATVADVFLNGQRILESDSMWAAHAVDVGRQLAGENELAIRFRALVPLLAERRKPRARWRTRLVAEGNLRFYRTMLIGRAPGFAPGPAAVGPWRPVRLVRRSGPGVTGLRLRTRLEGIDGVLEVTATGPPSEVRLDGPSGSHHAALVGGEDGALRAELRVPGVDRWWPHTHGTPALHEVTVSGVDGSARVGFRDLEVGDPEGDGLALRVNGTAIFARGALWSPLDPVSLQAREEDLRRALEQVRAAGMNMVRVPGTGAYESDLFHDLCDELGLLVWQDFMFANLDYPVADDHFRATVEAEARQQLDRLAGRPSTVVLCGNSEVEQQAAMVGLDPAIGRGPLFGEILPALVAEAGTDAVYLPSAPCGGDVPFRTDTGVANYFGVGAYRRPLEDARRADVRFASECLAFANVPDAAGGVVHDPGWKAGVPRDVGAGWDFEDVRDHYLAELYEVDPVRLRSVDHARYLELSRAVTGVVMAEVFGEWRRRDSSCAGGLVLWLRDLVAGAGWGLIDAGGVPKVAYHHLRRALAPRAVWMTDEGLGGIDVHVANDRPEPLSATLRVALYRRGEQAAGEASREIVLEGAQAGRWGVEELLGHFCDVNWSYRFGPPAQDVVVATLESGGAPVSQAFRFPVGRPVDREPAAALGLEADAAAAGPDAVTLVLSTRRVLYGARVSAPGWVADDDAFCLEPGRGRDLTLRPAEAGAAFEGAVVEAINLDGRVRVAPTS